MRYRSGAVRRCAAIGGFIFPVIAIIVMQKSFRVPFFFCVSVNENCAEEFCDVTPDYCI